jgi:hypothetical protein
VESFFACLLGHRRRQDLLELMDRLNPTIQELTAALEKEAKNTLEVQLLMSHPSIGPLMAHLLDRVGFPFEMCERVKGGGRPC